MLRERKGKDYADGSIGLAEWIALELSIFSGPRKRDKRMLAIYMYM